MKGYTAYFKDKKITVLGLGLLGKRIECIKFFSECGAHVLVTDIKSAKELAPALKQLKPYKNITYQLGKHVLSDFENRDFILKGQGTPLDSLYIKHAEKKGIPIEMDESLFLKIAPKDITVIGVTGTRGKTTTTMLIYHTLKKAGVRRVFLGGNIKGTAVLPLLKNIRSGDTLVLELSSWQLQGFGDAKISPHISVFTNFMKDHMNYYHDDESLYFQDKSYIYSSQTKNDICIVGQSVSRKINKKNINSKLTIVSENVIPKNWKLHLFGEHNMLNASYAFCALKAFGLTTAQIKYGFETFKGVEGRLEFIRTYKGISIYNDTCATTPEALSAAVTSFPKKHIVLVAGGNTKNLDLRHVVADIQQHTSEVILLPGTGTQELVSLFEKSKNPPRFVVAKNLKDAIKKALVFCTKGTILLFSPGFTSFGMFKNEYDRGDQFNVVVKSLS